MKEAIVTEGSLDTTVIRQFRQTVFSQVETWRHRAHDLCRGRAVRLHLYDTISRVLLVRKWQRTSFMSETTLRPFSSSSSE